MDNENWKAAHKEVIQEMTDDDLICSGTGRGAIRASEALDTLGIMFKLQAQLNDRIFEKHRLTDRSGLPLRNDSLVLTAQNELLGANDLPNTWLRKYSEALKDEVRELDAELLWKWWSKDKINIQNIRVEIIDIQHFVICLAMAAGLTAEEFFRLYQAKHAVNQDRQENDYSKENKTEADNEGVK